MGSCSICAPTDEELLLPTLRHMTLRAAMTKSVCIVGAGPAGIIAAKTLLNDHPPGTFKVTVFEKSERIGGLWPLSSPDDGMVNPDMCTNLSRHTVSFSDMAWPESSPTFPKAWQAGQYLKKYISKYTDLDIQTSSKVYKARRSQDLSSGVQRWTVEVAKKTSQRPIKTPLAKSDFTPGNKSTSSVVENEASSQTKHPPQEVYYFDHLIIASGFFGKRKLASAFSNSDKVSIPIQHSTQFRDVETLLQENQAGTKNQGNKILVVGGSMSGAEVAASIAIQLSSHVNSPKASPIKDVAKYKVHHVIRRPFWAMPLFLPAIPLLKAEDGLPTRYDPAPTFLPLDLVMYDLAKRPPGPIKNNSGRVTRERASFTNQYLESMVGTDQSELVNNKDSGQNAVLTMKGEITNEAPWLAISDTYAEFVRSGQIITTSGRVLGFSDEEISKNASAVISCVTGETIVDDIAAVVLATGFEATDSLGFLPEDVLQTLSYDPSCSSLPLFLDIHSTVHHKIPDLGFVGFYRGPFWGVMEMQARFLGKLWTGDEKVQEALNSHSSPIPDLRECYFNTPHELAQFPMGDYTYLMESFRELLDTELKGEPRHGPVLPSRYLSSSASNEAHNQSIEALSIVGKVFNDSSQNSKYVARAIFRSLQGDWTLQRSLISSISTYPSGTFRGSAKFFPRSPTAPEYDAEHLYFEEGDFETENGLKFRANRRYAYRYCEATDTLSAWFVKADNKSVDYLFHELEILPAVDGSGWRARAHHLCIADTYDVKYEFRFKGANIEEWTLAYSVKGPQKDYRIESAYRR